MRILVTTAAIWLSTSMAWAQAPATPPGGAENDTQPRATGELRPPVTTPAGSSATTDSVATPSAGATAGAAATESNGWRYRQHNGQWWYWMPSNRWVIWTGDKWTPYDPSTYARSSSEYRGSAYDPNNRGYYIGNYGNRGLLPNRPMTGTPSAGRSTPRSRIPGFGDEAGRGSALQGGGGDGTGGEIGSREEMGNIHAGGSVNSGQSSGARARANLGVFGAPGGQIGGSGASVGQGVGGRQLGGSPGIPGPARTNLNQMRANSEIRSNPDTAVGDNTLPPPSPSPSGSGGQP